MTKTFSQNYSYANNSIGDLINVSTAQRNEKYFCPICGELMNPHMGKGVDGISFIKMLGIVLMNHTFIG